jgi:hypothetical protein
MASNTRSLEKLLSMSMSEWTHHCGNILTFVFVRTGQITTTSLIPIPKRNASFVSTYMLKYDEQYKIARKTGFYEHV